jgi:hypothetical protein
MTDQRYPRSPKVMVGGMAHLGRLIDKVRMRHDGHIQDYNYLTVGFDKYLMEFLQIAPEEFEQEVLASQSDADVVAWVKFHGRQLSDEDLRQWNDRILLAGPKDDATRTRFQSRLGEVAAKRGVAVKDLPPASTWVDIIELDEDRM